MATDYDLNRFVSAQESTYQNALHEIISGSKKGHWMWSIFPQLKGLGSSSTSQYYGISNIQEAEAYLHHSILGGRLKEICQAALAANSNNATRIFGAPDDLKLKSSMTLFSEVANADSVFQQILDKFFDGKKDERTLQILKERL